MNTEGEPLNINGRRQKPWIAEAPAGLRQVATLAEPYAIH